METILKARSKGGSTFVNLTDKVRAKVNIVRGQLISNMLLLLTFLVIVNASSALIQFFKCDSFKIPSIDRHDDGVKKERYLFADYSIDCDSEKYLMMKPFAVVMIFVYPIGIPIVYSAMLFHHRVILR